MSGVKNFNVLQFSKIKQDLKKIKEEFAVLYKILLTRSEFGYMFYKKKDFCDNLSILISSLKKNEKFQLFEKIPDNISFEDLENVYKDIEDKIKNKKEQMEKLVTFFSTIQCQANSAVKHDILPKSVFNHLDMGGKLDSHSDKFKAYKNTIDRSFKELNELTEILYIAKSHLGEMSAELGHLGLLKSEKQPSIGRTNQVYAPKDGFAAKSSKAKLIESALNMQGICDEVAICKNVSYNSKLTIKPYITRVYEKKAKKNGSDLSVQRYLSNVGDASALPGMKNM